MTVFLVQICMVMRTFGQWIKIYRHLKKRHVHSNFSKLLSNTINYTTVIKRTVIRLSFRRSKVIQHCKKIQMSMAFIFPSLTNKVLELVSKLVVHSSINNVYYDISRHIMFNTNSQVTVVRYNVLLYLH